jgi:hypothetical protein
MIIIHYRFVGHFDMYISWHKSNTLANVPLSVDVAWVCQTVRGASNCEL